MWWCVRHRYTQSPTGRLIYISGMSALQRVSDVVNTNKSQSKLNQVSQYIPGAKSPEVWVARLMLFPPLIDQAAHLPPYGPHLASMASVRVMREPRGHRHIWIVEVRSESPDRYPI